MSERMAPDTFDRLAIAFTGSRLSGLMAEDLDRPSPCAGWTVRNILAHLVGGNRRFAQALRGQTPDWAGRDEEPVSSPRDEFDDSAALMFAAVDEIDDPKRPVLLPAGEPPASFAVAVHATDMLIHGWDLAVATGQDATLDPRLCAEAIAVIERYPSSFWGAGRFFADRVATASRDPQDRLLSMTGRNPAP